MKLIKDAFIAILIGLALILLSGCACKPEIRIEKVPVPPVIEMPVLRDAAGNQDKAQAIAELIAELKSRLAAAIEALNVYR